MSTSFGPPAFGFSCWLSSQIESVNYLMLAEAPLWGETKKYIYNPDINNSQFFYRSDLEDILNKHIADKKEFIQVCNEIGLLIVDISPKIQNRIGFLKILDAKQHLEQTCKSCLGTKERAWFVLIAIVK